MCHKCALGDEQHAPARSSRDCYEDKRCARGATDRIYSIARARSRNTMSLVLLRVPPTGRRHNTARTSRWRIRSTSRRCTRSTVVVYYTCWLPKGFMVTLRSFGLLGHAFKRGLTSLGLQRFIAAWVTRSSPNW